MKHKSQEIWKPIKGYSDNYEVSNYGRIRSLSRHIVQPVRGEEHEREIKGQEIAGTDNGNGYLIVGLSRDGDRKNHYIHRLVAEAFIERPVGTEVVNHKDFNKRNNHATNLEWCTQKDNVLHAVDRMTKPKSKCKPTNTGEKYIYKTSRENRGVYYRVRIKRKGKSYERCFRSLDRAKEYRDAVVRSWGLCDGQ